MPAVEFARFEVSSWAVPIATAYAVVGGALLAAWCSPESTARMCWRLWRLARRAPLLGRVLRGKRPIPVLRLLAWLYE